MDNALIIKDCRFSPNADFHLSNISGLNSLFENIIFESKVFFENVSFASVNWKNIFFLTDFRNNNVSLPSNTQVSQIFNSNSLLAFITA